jgi:hypothetical protein
MLFVAGLGLASCSLLQGSTRSNREASAPQAATSPTPTESPSPRGRDIGLGFPVCDVRRLSGIDFLGDGAGGTAWTATTFTEAGRCKKRQNSYLVAADLTGDGVADQSWGPIKHCFVCRPFGAADFDADGDDELVLLVQGGSVGAYQVLSAERTADGATQFGPVPVAPPGNSAGNLRPGKPIHFWTGGDEGFSAATGCDGYPDDPVLIVAWSNHPIEGPGSETTEIHITRLVLQDGAFHVVDSVNTEQPTASPLPEEFTRRGRQCGIRFWPF